MSVEQFDADIKPDQPNMPHGVTILCAKYVSYEFPVYHWHEVPERSCIDFYSTVPQLFNLNTHSAKVRVVQGIVRDGQHTTVKTRRIAILDDDVNAIWDRLEEEAREYREANQRLRRSIDELRSDLDMYREYVSTMLKSDKSSQRNGKE